ncbi:hypothetical protein PT282_05005 [Bifidobacterium sp. ESL0763]|uniref:hypothetical protein n=1 Tax=Bifidobacterium sp. ESL0763 TaxID=2983227 RepID=UPI0023F9E080|nr:hypothetical protein [Bifidobacterium sp. ESL0763]MDF7664020.1 hypothetical protein [Bifidobacterium sp. ESL0763]
MADLAHGMRRMLAACAALACAACLALTTVPSPAQAKTATPPVTMMPRQKA